MIAMVSYNDLIRNCLPEIKEIMPWDLVDRMKENPDLLILDVRESYEFEAMHISASLNVPRGILESACEWDYEDTVPELVTARKREIVVVCRSGNRSILAAYTLKQLGFEHAVSLRTGLRGWNDYEEPLFSSTGGKVDAVIADDFFIAKVRLDQRKPDGKSLLD